MYLMIYTFIFNLGMESFSASSSPLLYESIYNATKQVSVH